MKKILVALLVLALVAPAMADVAITSSFNNTTKNLTISFAPTAATVRGVAVTVTIDCAQVDAYVSSSFNTFVDYAFMSPSTYTISMAGQHPLALATTAGVETLPIPANHAFAVSVGYLDQTGAQLGLTTAGTVAVIHLASINPAGGTVTVVANAARGGAVVGDTIGAVTVTGTTIPPQIVDSITGPAVVTKTTAAPAIGTRVNSGRLETFTVSGVTGSSAVEYQFTFGDSTTSAWSTATTATKTYTYAASTAYNVTVQARLVSNPAMSITSAALALTSEEVKSSATTLYADWALYNRPTCWAYPRNCKGDVNGVRQGNATTGWIWVSTNDLTVFLAAYGVKEPTKGIGIMNIPGQPNAICADFDHLRQGNSTTGYIRVSTNDLTPFLASYGVKEPTKGPGVAVCAQTNYWYWTGAL